MSAAAISFAAEPDKAEQHLRRALDATVRHSDRLFAVLTVAEWITAVLFALWVTPLTWTGTASALHPHVSFAFWVGGVLATLPLALVYFLPGAEVTRLTVAASQMLFAGLMVHLSAGRIETHFFYFGLLALLAFYRDWRVLLLAAGVAAVDHLVRALWYPQSFYGVEWASVWRPLEHAAYVVFEVAFLLDLQRQSRREMAERAGREAELEHTNERFQHELFERTREATDESANRRRIAERLQVQNEVTQLLMSDGALDDVLARALEAMGAGMDDDWGGLWMAVPGEETLQLRAHWSRPGGDLEGFAYASRQVELSLGGPLARVHRTGQPLWLADYAEGRGTDRATAAEQAGLCNWIGVPVAGPTGTLAVWEFAARQGTEPDASLMECLTMTASMLARYLERESVRLALESSEGRYRLLFEDNPCPMWVIDKQTLRMLAANLEALRLYGYTLEEFLTLRGQDLRLPEDLPAYLQFVAEDQDRKSTPTGPIKGRWRHRTSSGGVIEVESTYHRMDWEGRDCQLAMVMDVTERIRLEREREAMEVQLRQSQKLESIGQLAAGIAHEINTPGQYVGDNLRFLKDSYADVASVLESQQRLLDAVNARAAEPDELAELASQAQAEVDRADVEYLRGEIPSAIDQALEGIGQVATIVAAMKEFSHPGKKEKALADLKQAISSTIVVSRNEWKYVADLDTEFDPGLPNLPCLVSEINQVVLNLIVNASHAIQDKSPNGEKGRITIRTRRDGEWAEIQVEDTGGGIPEHVGQRIFDPFFTTKEVGRGTGQGLAIARAVVVDKHGGTIHFETRPGEGTTFFIRLPLALEPVEALT